jgi:hypothetical protein
LMVPMLRCQLRAQSQNTVLVLSCVFQMYLKI